MRQPRVFDSHDENHTHVWQARGREMDRRIIYEKNA